MLSNASSIASSIAKYRTMVDYDNTKVENKIKMSYMIGLVINSSIAISIVISIAKLQKFSEMETKLIIE